MGGGGGGGALNIFSTTNYQSKTWMASKGVWKFQALGFNIFTPPSPPPVVT